MPVCRSGKTKIVPQFRHGTIPVSSSAALQILHGSFHPGIQISDFRLESGELEKVGDGQPPESR